MPTPVRVAAEYGALVGLPIVIILGVLHVGAGAQAPPDLAGEWTVSAHDAVRLAALHLDPLHEETLVLRVAQSGRYVVARLDACHARDARETLAGTRLAFIWDGDDAGCRGLRLDAALVNRRGEPMLVGTFTRPACPACADVPIVARRHRPTPDAER